MLWLLRAAPFVWPKGWKGLWGLCWYGGRKGIAGGLERKSNYEAEQLRGIAPPLLMAPLPLFVSLHIKSLKRLLLKI